MRFLVEAESIKPAGLRGDEVVSGKKREWLVTNRQAGYRAGFDLAVFRF